MRDFFISYTRVDESWATWIAWLLEEAGYSVFIQTWDIVPGDNFVAKMQEAMTQTHNTIAVLSEDYPKSPYAEDEWTYAITRRALVPVRVRPYVPAGFFATTVYVDIVGCDEQDARTAILGAFSARTNLSGGIPGTPPAPERRKPTRPPPFPGALLAPGKTAVWNVTGRIIDTADSGDIMTAPLRGHLRSAGTTLTAEERVRLYRNLCRLSLSQFNILVFALRPPAGAVAPLPAPQERRVEALLSWAEGVTGRGLSEVQEAFREMTRAPEETPEESAEADRGADVVKTCDRRKQEEDFNTFFKRCCEGRRSAAQLYIIEGPEMEGHKSLVERFCATTIMVHASGVRLTPWEPGWPQTGNLRVDCERIVSLLFEHAGGADVAGPPAVRARAFRGAAASLPQTVVVLHKLVADDWLRTTGGMVRSYVEFWDEFARAGGEGDARLFIIFLNVVYPDLREGSAGRLRRARHWLRVRRIKLGLRWLAMRMRARSPLASGASPATAFALLRELTCVSVKDVKDWMEKHRYGRFEGEWVRKSQQLFSNNGWELFECKSMADMEVALSDFIAERRRVHGAYT